MNILLTNDDGYLATGIRLIREKLSKIGKVYLFAPERGMSAKSVSITFGGTLLHVTDRGDDIYSIDGTPADCVALGIEFLKKEKGVDVDLVVSGCNNGYNLSYDSIYSGTIGACLEAQVYRIKAMAISVEEGKFSIVDAGFDMMWDFINKNNLLSKEYILNVNFPDTVAKGVSLAKEYYRKDENYFDKLPNGYDALRYMDPCENLPEDTDCYMVTHGIISIVPLMHTYFNESLYNKLKK